MQFVASFYYISQAENMFGLAFFLNFKRGSITDIRGLVVFFGPGGFENQTSVRSPCI